MHDILEIEFKGRRKEYASNPMQFPFTPGDPAIVEVERGHDLGRVRHVGWRTGMEADSTPAITVVRKAAAADLAIVEQNRKREREARGIARQKIADHHLEMKLVDVELQWDGRKMTFYFTAEGRVDFRELVKDLASTFRTRIDLRQIGARDETKRSSGYGVCGRPLCCATFLNEFKPITTQMPRDQFLPLNPSKLSGVCGRLKCCLRYELETYREFQRVCPKTGHAVRDDAGSKGSVEKLDLIREQIHVRFVGGTTQKFSPAEFVEFTNWRAEMPKTESILIKSRKPVEPPPPAVKPTPAPGVQPAPSAPQQGERVTLLAGGGLGMTSKDGTTEIQVGAQLFEPSSTPKKKRKRRHRKKGPTSASKNDEASPHGNGGKPTAA